VELAVNRVKLGGNGPIMANALATLGTRVTYIGNLGYPHLHPAFRELGRHATVYSIGEPAHTDALEFEDGKLMLGKVSPLNQITWDNLMARVGRERLIELFGQSNLVGLQNWTMIPHMSDIWVRLLEEVCPRLPALTGRCLFLDLADPERRHAQDIRHAAQLISRFEETFDTYLGLNEKESFEVARALGYTGESDGAEAVRGVARFLQDKLMLSGVVVHPRAYAVLASPTGTQVVEGPFTPKPLISTGAGDHFNAGFCLGKLIRADDSVSLQLGVGSSGYYVRTGKSPTATELAEFLRGLPS
jgi:hypothetical protein